MDADLTRVFHALNNHLIGVWIGNTDNSAMKKVTGITGAAPVWNQLMTYFLKDKPVEPFVRPPGLEEKAVCATTGLLPTKYCPSVTELFVPGTEPTSYDTVYQAFLIDRETGQLATANTPADKVEEKVFEIYPPEAANYVREASIPQPPNTFDTNYGPPPTEFGDVAIIQPGTYSYIHGVTPIVGNTRGSRTAPRASCQDWKKKFVEMAYAPEAAGHSAVEIPAVRGLEVVESILLLERHETEEADRLLVKALEMLGWGSWMELHGFIELARLRHMQRSDAGVQDILQRMRRLGPQHATCADSLAALFALKRSPGDPEARSKAESWTRKYAPDLSYPFALGIGPYHRDAEYICNLNWARVKIALKHYQEASLFIGPALRTARECGLLYRVAELSVQTLQVGVGRLADKKIVSGRIQQHGPVRAARRGVRGYLVKESVSLDLLACLKAVVLGQHYVSPVMSHLLLERRKQATRLSDHLPLRKRLTPAELSVLRLLSENKSRREIAEVLFISVRTVENHRARMCSKLDLQGHNKLLQFALENRGKM